MARESVEFQTSLAGGTQTRNRPRVEKERKKESDTHTHTTKRTSAVLHVDQHSNTLIPSTHQKKNCSVAALFNSYLASPSLISNWGLCLINTHLKTNLGM